MHYFDPARPVLPNGLPMYVNASGRGIAALPDVCIEPISVGWRVCLLLCPEPNVGRWFTTEVATWTSLQRLLQEWREDPEAVLRTWFHYEYRAAPPVQDVSLEDLGL